MISAARKLAALIKADNGNWIGLWQQWVRNLDSNVVTNCGSGSIIVSWKMKEN